MKLPIEQLSGFLVGVVEQIKLARCEAEKQGLATLLFDESFSVTVEVIAAGGTNALVRPEESVSFESENRTLKPEEVQRQELGLGVSETVAAGFVGTSTSEKTEAKSVQTQKTPASITLSERTSEANLSETRTFEKAGGSTGTETRGGDTRTTNNFYS